MQKIIKFIVVLAFIISPILSLAQTVEDQDNVSVESSSVCVSINRSLRYRASDRVSSTKDVLLLQNFLKEKDYLKAEPNGFFGEQTLSAVRAFQRDNNLVSAGFVGPLTRESINKLTCSEKIPQEIDSGLNTKTEEVNISGDIISEIKEVEKVDDKKIEEVINISQSTVSENSKTQEENKNEDKQKDKTEIDIDKKSDTKPPREDLLPRVMF